MQSSFNSFSRKTFRLTDLDNNYNWKYNITVIWMQFLARRTSVLSIFMSLVFKFLKIFVLLLCIQGIRRNRCWGDNSTPVVLLDNIENYLTFYPWHQEGQKNKQKKKEHTHRSQRFLKLMKIETDSLYLI